MRLTEREGEELLREGDLIALGREADKIRQQRFGNTTTFIIDRNINYTNVCVNECRFCAFFRRQGSKDAYLLTHEEILEKVRETVEAGGTQVMIQGGLYPELALAYYEKMLRLIKDHFPTITIHSFTATEIQHFAREAGLSILETLKRYNVKATFFLCGFWVEKYPDKVKAIHDAGHELGNHTATHPHMNKLSSAQMQKEIEDFEAMMVKVTGERTKVFRAPYGEYNDSVITTVRSLGYEVLQWDLDTVDWKEERSAETILNSVLPKLHPGCIILCHNNGYKIKEYLPKLLETAISEGYELVTISELLLEGDTIIDVNGVQKKAQ